MKTIQDNPQPRGEKHPLLHRMILMLVAVGLLFGGIFGYQMYMMRMSGKAMANQTMPPAIVSAMPAELADWQPELKAVATLRAAQGVDITSEITGMVDKILFKSGDVVTAGQVLVQLNAETDLAQLHAKEAEAELAKTVYERDKKQFAMHAVSQAVLDADAADLKSKLALVAEKRAELAKKTILAPFSGKLGISTISRGQFIDPGEKIVTLQSLDPLYADFHLPQQNFPVLSPDQVVRIGMDAYPGRAFNGRISSVNPLVDRETRNIQVEAAIDNHDHLLLPGMFASVVVQAGKSMQFLTVPKTSVTYNPYGETIYVIQESGKGTDGRPMLVARQVFVTTGASRGDQVAILKGIKEGDNVVTSGQMKLKNDSPVVINNKITPKNDKAPQPVDE
jgi:membrane fusion protein (multidrug efflux system)